MCPPGEEGHACIDVARIGLKCEQFPGAPARVNNCTSACKLEFFIDNKWYPQEYCFPDVWIPPKREHEKFKSGVCPADSLPVPVVLFAQNFGHSVVETK